MKGGDLGRAFIFVELLELLPRYESFPKSALTDNLIPAVSE